LPRITGKKSTRSTGLSRTERRDKVTAYFAATAKERVQESATPEKVEGPLAAVKAKSLGKNPTGAFKRFLPFVFFFFSVFGVKYTVNHWAWPSTSVEAIDDSSWAVRGPGLDEIAKARDEVASGLIATEDAKAASGFWYIGVDVIPASGNVIKGLLTNGVLPMRTKMECEATLKKLVAALRNSGNTINRVWCEDKS
jgi:hypothetical protein